MVSGKIRIFKCGYFEHTLGSSPHKESINRYAEGWRTYWNEKITTQNNFVYRCKACLFIKNRNKKFNERNLPADYVVFKLTGKVNNENEIKNIPKSLIETYREVLRLKNIIKNPVVTCNKHGELFVHKKQVIKSGKDESGTQKYRCKKCMSELHRDHYARNKDAVLKKHAEYRKNNPIKRAETKAKSWRKMKDEQNNQYEAIKRSSIKSD